MAKPTIHELEAILEEEPGRLIILPSGEVQANDYIAQLEATVAQLVEQKEVVKFVNGEERITELEAQIKEQRLVEERFTAFRILVDAQKQEIERLEAEVAKLKGMTTTERKLQVGLELGERDKQIAELEAKLHNAYKETATTVIACGCGRAMRPRYKHCKVCEIERLRGVIEKLIPDMGDRARKIAREALADD